MRMRSLGLAVLVAPFASATLAATCASSSVTVSGDKTQANIIYTDFSLLGGAADPTSQSIDCTATSADIAAPGYRVFSADVRTAGTLDTGQSYRLERDGEEWVVVNGPLAGDDTQLAVARVGLGPNEDLNLPLTLTLNDNNGADAEAVVDSVDLFQVASISEDELQDTLDGMARDATATIVHLGASANLLLGGLQPIEGETELGGLAAAGSFLAGANGRVNVTDGFSVFGGAALFQQDAGTSAGGLLLAMGARYVSPQGDAVRFFGEGGAWGAPAMSMGFTRTYQDGGGFGIDPSTVTTSSTVTGTLANIYGKAGVLVDIDPANQLALYGSLSAGVFTFGAFSEAADPANAFALSSDGGAMPVATAKLGASWTVRPVEALEITAAAAVGATSGGPLTVDVAFAGEQAGMSGPLLFAEGGLRVGYHVTDDVKLDAFVLGTAGPEIGAHVQVGGGVSVQF